jgi:hypothetical protein
VDQKWIHNRIQVTKLISRKHHLLPCVACLTYKFKYGSNVDPRVTQLQAHQNDSTSVVSPVPPILTSWESPTFRHRRLLVCFLAILFWISVHSISRIWILPMIRQLKVSFSSVVECTRLKGLIRITLQLGRSSRKRIPKGRYNLIVIV